MPSLRATVVPGFLCLQTDILLSVGRTELTLGFLAKPEVLGCEAESRAGLEKDFCSWEKNMTPGSDCSGAWGLVKKPLDAEWILDHVGP